MVPRLATEEHAEDPSAQATPGKASGKGKKGKGKSKDTKNDSSGKIQQHSTEKSQISSKKIDFFFFAN